MFANANNMFSSEKKEEAPMFGASSLETFKKNEEKEVQREKASIFGSVFKDKEDDEKPPMFGA